MGTANPALSQPPSLIPKGLDATLFGSALTSIVELWRC